jgi:hypothetical protein
MLTGVVALCLEHEPCRRILPVPDGLPFVPTKAVIAWAPLFLACLVVPLRRLTCG